MAEKIEEKTVCLAWISSDYFESFLLPQLLRGENDSKQSDEFQVTVCPVFKLLGAHMIVCFRPFFLRLLKRKKKQKHFVKVARAKPEHLFHICTVTTLPSPTHFEPPLHWYEGVFHSIRVVSLLFCNLVKCPQRPLNKELCDRCNLLLMEFSPLYCFSSSLVTF